jgi:GntR family transcriptional regulator, transcriptional repressor for pyruvate dehydrogenase complex
VPPVRTISSRTASSARPGPEVDRQGLSFIVQPSNERANLSEARLSVRHGPELPRLGRSSLRDQVADALETRILDGSFEAGSRLPTEHELTESFGVSRTVVRDALRLLEARGLVDTRRGTGTLVKSTSVDAYSSAAATMLLRSDLTVGDVFAARAALEGQLALVAAKNYTPALLERVESALHRFDSAVHDGADVRAIVSGHVEFHTELLRATNLPALEILLRPIQEMLLATSVVARGADPRDPRGWRVDVHRALLEAVASRDPSAVVAASDKHWSTPLRGRSYRETRRTRLGAMLVSPREMMAIPGGADARR